MKRPLLIMKPRFLSLHRIALMLAAALGLALAAQAAATQTNAPPMSTNAAPVEVEIPKSVFVIPAVQKDGRDPFFPRSVRPYGSPQIVTTNRSTIPIMAELVVNGISGSPEKPLAIINNVTFGVGDDGEVVSAGRKFRIRCLEINAGTGIVTVQNGSQRQQLRFPGGK
jgi:hypothetical protein